MSASQRDLFASVRRPSRSPLAVALAVAIALPASAAGRPQDPQPPMRPSYPTTKKVDQVDAHWGVQVPDPYRWLEQDVRESPEVRDWVRRENDVTFAYLKKLPGRERIERRLTELWNYARRSAPSRVGEHWVCSRNDGLQNHSVVYVSDTPDGEARVLFDPNTWSEDGTVALGGMSFSRDGRYCAYGIQDGGSDWRTWRVRDVATGTDLPDVLEHLKFTSPSWDARGEGFFYSKYPDPAPGAQFTSLNLENKVMYHRLGTPQSEDYVVYWRPEHPDWNYGAFATEDGRWLVIQVSVGTDDRYRIYLKDLAKPYAAPVPLVDEFENDYGYVWNDGPVFYMTTDVDAPRQRVVRIDVRRPAREHWVEVVPQREEPLLGVSFVGNLLICQYLRDVKTAVELHALDGRHVRTVEMPGVGTAGGFDGEPHDTFTFYSFSSFATPPSIYRYDLLTGTSELFWRAKVDFDAASYVTEQVFYRSKDGTRVPMFVTHKKGIELDGSHPTLLYGYGGFDISLQPGFSVSRAAWLELGGIYAVANLRGGGEYGRAWHEAGKQMEKQNVFDDFIAAAEFLIAKGYTRSDKLAIQGGSNGGLLVGACMAQRPELFAVALPAVGVMDMLRYDEFTAGRYWTDDYGSAKDSEAMFRYLLRYSPYHALRDGVSYPATLVTTADTDDRVVPGHSFKFAARLQEAQAGPAPVLIRIETRAGHGSGKPTAMQIEEIADIYAFALANLGARVGS
ncbi:MAG: S9 family peptidase [Planctomycetes bacterium]|nr:S9 family peptidase [Planctomycetota bacterium]